MADKKISELVELTSLATDDVLPVVDTGSNATKRITAANLSKFPAGVTIPDGSTIGSASDPDAMSIAAGGAVTFSQNIKMAAGKGIDFSANANAAGMTSELLDDYEEGTWTPTWQFSTSGSVTQLAVLARYTKIGSFVAAYARLITTNTSSPTGDAYITGLPFASTSGEIYAVNLGELARFATDFPRATARIENGTEIFFYKQASNSTELRWQGSDFTASSGTRNIIGFTAFYYTTS